jgi:hypothetical protein
LKGAAVGSVNSPVVWAMNWRNKTCSLKPTKFDDQVIHPKIMEEI